MGVECYKVEQRNGRKDYVCQLCGKRIVKGREHIYESGRYEGSFFGHRRHIHCNAIADAFFAESWTEDEYNEDDIWNYCREEGCRGCSPDIREDCIDDMKNPFWCPKVIERLTKGNDQRAALTSLAENREDGQ